MLQEAMEAGTGLGPNYSTDPENFFQSDRDIELQRARNAKKAVSESTEARGSPVPLPSKVLTFELVPGAEDIAYIAESGHVARKLNLKTRKSLAVFRGHSGPVTSLAIVYSSTGEDIALITGSWDKTIKKWDARTGALIATFTGHTDFIKEVLVHNNTLYSASSDASIRSWDLDTGACIRVFREHTRAVEDIAFSDDGVHLYSASSDTKIKKWDVRSGDVVATLDSHLTSVYRLVVAEGALWSASADNTAKRWDLETNEADSSFGHPDFVRSLAVFPGGAHLVTGSRDENIRIFDVASEKCLLTLSGHFGEVSDIKIRGATIWTSSLDGTIRSWPITDKELQSTPTAAVAELQEQQKRAADAKAAAKPTVAKPKKKAAVTMTAEEERELAELMGSDDDE
ncbi:hypothetical protein HDU87_006811 [Geranomyces variabilis]|uniref:WD40 repeat-like protein n=1 Tax=Geranomyces variabilis TaxID=109894 RepID=A0AAD5TRY8_9FUNG|nr:hypothetical protein HDU87_006811 [Geranomyces variabilis]